MRLLRCTSAIRFGPTLCTRCTLAPDHDGAHLGKGFQELEFQRIIWETGDSREFETSDDNEWAWEEVKRWALGPIESTSRCTPR
jgi:hypothetical protein